jgi:hypothetical protein
LGEHFDLGLVKLPATTSSTTSKVGSLFINPEGPYSSAAGIVTQIGATVTPDEAFLASFDIIGLDPRGVGLSHQAQCDLDMYTERVSLFLQTEADFEILLDKNKRLSETCRNLTGAV